MKRAICCVLGLRSAARTGLRPDCSRRLLAAARPTGGPVMHARSSLLSLISQPFGLVAACFVAATLVCGDVGDLLSTRPLARLSFPIAHVTTSGNLPPVAVRRLAVACLGSAGPNHWWRLFFTGCCPDHLKTRSPPINPAPPRWRAQAAWV